MIGKIITVCFVFLLVVGITSATGVFHNDDGSGITLFVSMPQGMANSLENLPLVDFVELDGDTTNIYLTTNNPDQFLETADYLEHKLLDNEANVLEISGVTAPLCMRDQADGQVKGVYLNNEQLSVVDNDPLCPS